MREDSPLNGICKDFKDPRNRIRPENPFIDNDTPSRIKRNSNFGGKIDAKVEVSSESDSKLKKMQYPLFLYQYFKEEFVIIDHQKEPLICNVFLLLFIFHI